MLPPDGQGSRLVLVNVLGLSLQQLVPVDLVTEDLDLCREKSYLQSRHITAQSVIISERAKLSAERFLWFELCDRCLVKLWN